MANSETEQSPARNQRKTRVGVVSGAKMAKTVTVVVERRAAHPGYGKQVTSTKKYHAHDEKNEFHPGDVVTIEECRPLSRTKTWQVVGLVEKARPE
jgi:small subunit ribosomal protein S17